MVENDIIRLAGRRCPTRPIRFGEVLPGAQMPAAREYLEKTPASSAVWNGSTCRQIGVRYVCPLVASRGGRVGAKLVFVTQPLN